MKKRGILLLSLIIIFFSTIYIYFFSGRYAVGQIVLLGQSDISKEEIFLQSGIDKSKNIYLIDIKKARENILKNPYIEDVVIKREFPDKLTFSVKQRLEIATVPFEGGYCVIDSKGIVLRILHDQSNIIKPLIKGIDIENVKISEKIDFKNDDKAQDFLEIIEAVSSLNLLMNISYIDMTDFNLITLATNSGIDVLVGDMDNLSYKLKLLNKILIDLQSKAVMIGTVDMRYDTDPIYTVLSMEEITSMYGEKLEDESEVKEIE